jgi:outer membrane lipoprotein-sorting protein
MNPRSTAFVCLMAVLFAVSAAAQTADELIAKNIEAKGGIQKIKAIKTRRMTGKVVYPGGFELGYTQVNARPNMLREDSLIQGMNVIQAYDGKMGWQIDPTQGKKTPEPVSEDDLRSLTEDADFDGPLVDYKEKGSTVEFAGKEPDVDGSPAYKLVVKQKNGDVKTVYLDEDYYLEVKIETKRRIRGAERESEMLVGDYKEVGGVMMPHAFEQKQKGAAQALKISYRSIESNPQIPEGYFQMPGTKTSAAK